MRSNQRIQPQDRSVFRYEELPWVTLLTCQGYNEAQEIYRCRNAIRAVLVSIETSWR